MKSSHLILTLILAAVVSYGTVKLTVPEGMSGAPEKEESVYDRVMRTGKIRCGYAYWAPALMKDDKTGEMSGIYYDYVEALGEAMGLEIEWSQELSLATYLQDLKAGRYDLECSGGWPNAIRGKYGEYTQPIFFTPVYAYAQHGDTQFDHNIAAINNEKIRFAAMHGETSAMMHQRRFPDAQLVEVPPTSPLIEILYQVQFGKADVTIADSFSTQPYIDANPGTLRQVISKPLRIIPNNMTVAKGEHEFREMLDTATRELLYDGVIERILQKYDVNENVALRVAPPYKRSEDKE